MMSLGHDINATTMNPQLQLSHGGSSGVISGCSEATQQMLNLGLGFEQTAVRVRVEKGLLVDLYYVVSTP